MANALVISSRQLLRSQAMFRVRRFAGTVARRLSRPLSGELKWPSASTGHAYLHRRCQLTTALYSANNKHRKKFVFRSFLVRCYLRGFSSKFLTWCVHASVTIAGYTRTLGPVHCSELSSTAPPQPHETYLTSTNTPVNLVAGHGIGQRQGKQT